MATYTGNSTTLGFATTDIGGGETTAMSWISIAGFDWTRPSINNSHLGTSYWEAYIPGDLWDAGEMSADFIFDPDQMLAWKATGDVDSPWELTPGADLSDSETITITFPSPSPTLVGAGFITGISMGEITNNERITGTVTWRYCNSGGSQGPYFAAAV